MSDTRTIMERYEGTEEERKFMGAFNTVLHIDKKDYTNFIGGLMVASGNEYSVSSPIDTSIIFGTFQDPEPGTADRAVDAAARAHAEWSKEKPSERVALFERFLDRLTRQRYRFAAIACLSTGMTIKDSLNDVDAFIKIVENACADASGVKGRTGVWAIISEHASPLAAPAGMAVCAMIVGNAVVALPSARVPMPMYFVHDLLNQVGLPAGVFNLIVDPRGGMATEITNNPGLAGVAAAGGGERLEDLMFMASDDELLFVNEIKGMNPIFVYRPEDMGEAAAMVAESAFSYAGQHHAATSMVVVTQAERKALVDALIPLVKGLSVGDPVEPGVKCGPVISAAMADEFEKVCDGVRDYIVAGGTRITTGMGEYGHYVRPALVDGLPDGHPMNEMDSCLPILSVRVVHDVDEALEAINDCEYGTTSGMISKDAKALGKFREEADAEVLFVNRPSTEIRAGVRARVGNFVG
ncbi:MAG: aldehyde dehydrogenase family protein [Thermoplasmatales archaeon]|nr:aldehyde dehydrogenase family protein [Thermoplasmatales archaeon]